AEVDDAVGVGGCGARVGDLDVLGLGRGRELPRILGGYRIVDVAAVGHDHLLDLDRALTCALGHVGEQIGDLVEVFSSVEVLTLGLTRDGPQVERAVGAVDRGPDADGQHRRALRFQHVGAEDAGIDIAQRVGAGPASVAALDSGVPVSEHDHQVIALIRYGGETPVPVGAAVRFPVFIQVLEIRRLRAGGDRVGFRVIAVAVSGAAV